MSCLPHPSPRPFDLPEDVDRADPVALATAISHAAIDEAFLLVVHDDGTIATEPLIGRDPVDSLCGRHAPADAAMVGLAAPATVTRAPSAPTRCGVVAHLLTRDGVSVTAVRAEDGEHRCFGPDVEPQSGRVPDSCRRMLGLPTPPAESTMTPFVFGAWLAVLDGRDRSADEILDWQEIVALHPVASTLPANPTAAQLATATSELGESMDWDRFRRVIATVGGFPFGPEGAEMARWSDAGMFSRWALDELPRPDAALARVSDLVTADALDRLWASAHLCGAIDERDELPTA